MDNSSRPPWLSIAIFAGVVYTAIAVASAALAGAAASPQMQSLWRLSAFVVSGVVLMAHVGHEHFRLRNATLPAAWHATAGAAFGGLGIALMANIHDLVSPAGYRPRMLIALVVWPLLTAVPAFIFALVAAAGLSLRQGRP